jgi:hypothetical protein
MMKEISRKAFILFILLVATAGLAQEEKPRFHGSAPGHKVDYQGLFESAEELADSPEGQIVLEKCLEAYGGQEKLQQLQSFKIRYEKDSTLSGKPEIVEKTFQRGRKYRTVSGEDSRIINSQTCWYEHQDQVAELDGTRYRAELFSYLTLAMPLAATTERFDSIRYGKRNHDSLHYLYFDKADSVLTILGIDPETHLIKSSTGVIPQGENNFVYINEFSGHKSHESFVFPGQVTFFSLGMRIGIAEVREVSVNPDFESMEFYPRNKLEK